jgi:hypothetical protein
MDEAVEDCVGDGWIADNFVPSVDRDLTGDDDGSCVVATRNADKRSSRHSL